jgi:hypothetical protein
MSYKIVFSDGRIVNAGKEYSPAQKKVQRLIELGYQCKLTQKHLDTTKR